jgi:tight adherence protein B
MVEIFLVTCAGIVAIYILYVTSSRLDERKKIHSKIARSQNIRSRSDNKDSNANNKKAFKSSNAQNTSLDAFFKNLNIDSEGLVDNFRFLKWNINLLDFFVYQIGITLILTAIFIVALGMPIFIAIPVALILGLLLPIKYVKGKVRKRIALFNYQFPDALDLMVRGLRTGMPISECIGNIQENLDAPVADEFGQIRDDIKLGLSVPEAVWKTGKRLNTQEYNFFAISIGIQSETGGNLAESLETLTGVLRSRQKILRMIRAKSSEARMTGKILGALPFVIFALIYAMSPDYAGIMIHDTRGNIAAGVAVAWLVMGLVWMNSMAKFDF